MTKTEESQSPGNIERAEVGNANNADLVLRIHCDSAESSSSHGASMLVPGNTGYAAGISEITNLEEDYLLSTDSYQYKLADGLCNGILNVLS